jgi:hypothetical protein
MPRKKNVCSVLEAGIDWFTCTVNEGLRQGFCEAKCERVMKALEDGGSERTFTNRLGFVGDRVEHFFYGKRGETLMVIGTGEVAIKEAPFFLGLATTVTRLDLAVTLLDDDIDRDWSLIAYEQASMDGRVDSGLLKTHRIEGTPDGRTLYLGSRSSDRFIRIYDKTAESKGVYPERSWRWEVEYKKPRAGMVAARFLRAGSTPTAVLDIVASALADLRVKLPVDHLPDGWIPRRPRLLTTEETRLVYTTRVIAPFIKRLIDAVGEEKVMGALDKAHLGHSYRSTPPRSREAP